MTQPSGSVEKWLEPRVWCNPDPNEGLYSLNIFQLSISDEAISALTAVNGAIYYNNTLENFFGLNSGSSADYTYMELDIKYSYGIELRDGPGGPCTFELPEDQILPTATENFAALRVIMNRILNAKQ